MEWQGLTDKHVLETIAKRLKEYRVHKRFTQQELAEKSGISEYSVQKMEQGKPVSLRIFIPILRTLKLLNQLESLVPDVSISPIQLLEQQGTKVQRVRKRRY